MLQYEFMDRAGRGLDGGARLSDEEGSAVAS